MPHENYLDCIESCNACAAAYNHCAISCLRENGANASFCFCFCFS